MPKFQISFFLIFIFTTFGFFDDAANAQQVRVLTCDDAINIALKYSFTVKSAQEKKTAMQHYFNYYKAQFKPRLDFNLFAPSWNEYVTPIQRADGLPVYNSVGSMQLGGELTFTYTLPTGGNLALSSLMYQEKQTTVLALKNYEQLTSSQAYTSLSLSFTQPIFTRNELDENLEEARYSYEQSSSYFSRGQMNIIYNVTAGFYTLYRATRHVEIAHEKLKNSEESYRIARLMAEAGRKPEADVLIAEVALAQNRANLLEMEGDLAREKDSFKQLVGLTLDEEIDIVTDLKYDTFSIDLGKATQEALKNRLELKESQFDIKLQKIALDRAGRERELKGSISAYYDITGISTIGTGSTNDLFQSSLDNFVDRPPNRGVTFTVEYPLWDWGRGSARVQQAKAYLREAEMESEDWKTTIMREVRDVVRTVKEAQNRLAIHEKNQFVSQRSYRISRMRFENGDITSQELGVEQERLAESQISYLNAFITYQLAVADLKRKTMWDFKENRSYLKEDYLLGE